MTPDICSTSERRGPGIEKLGAPNFSLTPLPAVAMPGLRVRASARGIAAGRTSGALARQQRIGKLGAPNFFRSPLPEGSNFRLRSHTSRIPVASVPISGTLASSRRIQKLGAPNSSTHHLVKAPISLIRQRPVGSSQLLRSRLAQQPGGHS